MTNVEPRMTQAETDWQRLCTISQAENRLNPELHKERDRLLDRLADTTGVPRNHLQWEAEATAHQRGQDPSSPLQLPDWGKLRHDATPQNTFEGDPDFYYNDQRLDTGYAQRHNTPHIER